MSAVPTFAPAPWHPSAHGAVILEPVQSLDQIIAAHLDSLCLLMAGLEQQSQQPPTRETPTRISYREALARLADRLTTPVPQITRAEPQKQVADTKARDAAFIAQVQTQAEAELGNCLFGVNELAAAMAMTRRHLARRFADLIGQPPSQWLRDLRLSRAEQLLRHGKLNVAQVANQVGFAKPSYFAQQFKHQYGCTPSAYRRGRIAGLT